MNILIRLGFYQKVSVYSRRTKEQETWSLQQGDSEKCQEHNVDHYMTFFDFTKEFYTAVMGFG